MISKKHIDGFLSKKRLAVIGVSRSKPSYSRMLFAELRAKGYDVVPVNPNAQEIDGVQCHAAIGAVQPAVDGVIMLLQTDKTEQAMIECADAGVKDVWMHNHLMAGVQNTKAIYQAEKNNIALITGFCPFMFLPKTGLMHRMHGGFMKLVGAYPK